MRTKLYFLLALVIALTSPVATLMIARAAGLGRSEIGSRAQGPCDIYSAAGNPCVTAHSTTRALLAAYNGPLYQVKRESDGKTLDIGIVAGVGGYADAAAQDAFCADSLCVITVIYDQSGKGNHLYQAAPGTFKGPDEGGFNTLPIADMAPVTIGGHKVYGVYIMPGMGFRNNTATGIAINDEEEGMYYVIDGTHYDSGCCFDYGNASPNGHAVGTGTMETVYFGTASAWGTGDGPGPWIEADFEAGVFSGYSAKKNAADPTIDSWRFVTAVVDGGGGNRWDLRGGNAQQGALTTYYSGVRPGSSNNNSYFPMHKKGAVLLGNGGDNGNGSAGTFYEGVMTTGYPKEATTDAVQANVVAAKYDVQSVSLSNVKAFLPGSTQEVTVSFKNTSVAAASGVKLGVSMPQGWSVEGAGATKTLLEPVAPGASVSATFEVRSPKSASGGYVRGRAEWSGAAEVGVQAETVSARVRSVYPVKINEVRLSNQFIELYNASGSEVDISGWIVENTQSQWAPVRLARIPAGTKLAGKGFYLLGLSGSGLASGTSAGATTIQLRSVAGIEAGQKIEIDGESRTVASVGTAAAPMTTVFIPVSAGPWVNFPAGATNLPVASAAGFVVGEKVAIGQAGTEVATVTAVGKAGTQTTLSEAAKAGAMTIKIAASADMTVGDTLTVDAGARKETCVVKSIISSVAAPAGRGGGGGGFGGGARVGEVELAGPLKLDHMAGIDVSDPGTGISFTPATRFAHVSGQAIQALGSGVVIDSPLAKAHENGAPVNGAQIQADGYQGPPEANQWFGGPLSGTAGSIALLDGTSQVVVDAVVYGSRQSSSSANGTIASPELATLMGNQGQGGCIVVAPSGGRGGGRRGTPAAGGGAVRSLGRTSDGADTGSLCTDFQTQGPTPGASNQAQ